RIISEDESPAEAPAAPAAVHAAPVLEEEEVLELTDRYEEQVSVAVPVMHAAPEPAAPHAVGDIEAFEAPRAQPAPQPAPVQEPRFEPPAFQAYASEEHQSLISDHVADRAASAFDSLSQSLMMPASGRSLEDVVREMLKPMLREWLDQNLNR